jgi:hypothetical protein
MTPVHEARRTKVVKHDHTKPTIAEYLELVSQMPFRSAGTSGRG